MFERNADSARNQIAAAAHPVRPLVAHPDDLVEASGIVGQTAAPPRGLLVPSLNPIKLRGVSAGAVGKKPRLRPAKLGGAIGQARKLPDGVKRDLRIIGAGLNRNVASGPRGFELVAVEFRQVDKRRRPLGRKPITVHSVLDEKPGPKPNVSVSRDGERPSAEPPSGPSTETSWPESRTVSPAHIRAAPQGPKPNMATSLSRRLGETIERGEIGVRLLAGGDSALMEAEVRFSRSGVPTCGAAARGAAR